MNERTFENEIRKAGKLFSKLSAWRKDLSINPFPIGEAAHYEWARLYGQHGLTEIGKSVRAA